MWIQTATNDALNLDRYDRLGYEEATDIHGKEGWLVYAEKTAPPGVSEHTIQAAIVHVEDEDAVHEAIADIIAGKFNIEVWI